MKITLTPTSQKQFLKLPKSEIKKITRKINSLAADPYSAKKLKGEFSELYSLRAWPYRIVYQICPDRIEIVLIEHRQSVYR